MSEYSEYFTAPKFVVVTTEGGKVRHVFGPFDTRQEGLAFAGSPDRAFDVVKLTAPVRRSSR